MKILTLSSVLVFLCKYEVTLSLPGPRVFVVTPSSRISVDEGRSAPQPFYYHNWMRRMDTPQNVTTTTSTTAAPIVKTPDLIFAEFEDDKMKNIRKLLEKERITPKTTTTTTITTAKPIYVPDEDMYESTNYGLPPPMVQKEENKNDMTDYFAYYNNLYNINDNVPSAPVYLPSTTTTKTSTTTTTPAPLNNVENIWHIIDREKLNQYSGQWDEVPISPENNKHNEEVNKPVEGEKVNDDHTENDDEKIDENFALPGFATQSLTSGENESRAIRTEPDIRFPYVSLKPFQMKNSKKPLINMVSNSKKGNNMYTSLDNFFEVKNPVRGEVQDTVPIQHPMMNMPIDRYNPAQPYFPASYGSKSKQSSPASTPSKTYANLVPPPPPPPKVSDSDFPAPSTYESFPPFAPAAIDSAPHPPPPPPPASAPKPPVSMIQPPMDSDTDSGPDSAPPSFGYQYRPPAPPAPPSQNFLPTLPPLKKPFEGYSYNKPPMTVEAPPADTDDKPDFQGYNYDKPPAMPDIPSYGYHYDKPEPPAPPKDQGPSYDHPPHDHDYPELIFSKHHGNGGDVKGEDDKTDDMGMVPPPMPDMKPGMDAMDANGPPDDSGFPHDFPGDFKYHHDFDDHDFYHHHHHHTTTTTTTTEMPRVNRYSYYYLGKKLYYLPLYFSVYFIIYVGALIIKAVLRHKIVYPNSWRPNDQTASFLSKRSIDSMDLSKENLHEITGRVTHAIATAAERYMKEKNKLE